MVFPTPYLSDSLFDEVLAPPQLDTTLPASLDTVSDDLLNARLTAQRSTPVPYEPPYCASLAADKCCFLDL
jgi:hypothetical protein